MIASPPQEIKITGATVFVNPYEELLEEEAKKEEAKRKAVSFLTRCASRQVSLLWCLHGTGSERP